MGFVYFVIIMAVGIGMYFTGRSMGMEWTLRCFLDQLIEENEKPEGSDPVESET